MVVNFFPHLTNDYSTANSNIAYYSSCNPSIYKTNLRTRLHSQSHHVFANAYLSIDQSNRSPGSLDSEDGFPHRLSKRHWPKTVLIRTPITQMIFSNLVSFPILISSLYLTYCICPLLNLILFNYFLFRFGWNTWRIV